MNAGDPGKVPPRAPPGAKEKKKPCRVGIIRHTDTYVVSGGEPEKINKLDFNCYLLARYPELSLYVQVCTLYK